MNFCTPGDTDEAEWESHYTTTDLGMPANTHNRRNKTEEEELKNIQDYSTKEINCRWALKMG